jgi:flagellar basal body-associated protein FliL
MWLLILVAFALLFAGVASVLGGGIVTIILIPIVLTAAVAVAAAAWIRRHASDEVASSQPQPTGRPQSASPGAGTANERVGQG